MKKPVTTLLVLSLLFALVSFTYAAQGKQDYVQEAIKAIAALPAPETIVAIDPDAGKVVYNTPSLLAAIGVPASGSDANAVPATGINKLIEMPALLCQWYNMCNKLSQILNIYYM